MSLPKQYSVKNLSADQLLRECFGLAVELIRLYAPLLDTPPERWAKYLSIDVETLLSQWDTLNDDARRAHLRLIYDALREKDPT